MGQKPRTKERDEVMQRSRIRVVGRHVLEPDVSRNECRIDVIV